MGKCLDAIRKKILYSLNAAEGHHSQAFTLADHSVQLSLFTDLQLISTVAFENIKALVCIFKV